MAYLLPPAWLMLKDEPLSPDATLSAPALLRVSLLLPRLLRALRGATTCRGEEGGRTACHTDAVSVFVLCVCVCGGG